MPTDPQTYNVFRTDEVMRKAAVKAAERGMKILDAEGAAADIPSEQLRDLGLFIRGCASAMHWPEENTGPDFDEGI